MVQKPSWSTHLPLLALLLCLALPVRGAAPEDTLALPDEPPMEETTQAEEIPFVFPSTGGPSIIGDLEFWVEDSPSAVLAEVPKISSLFTPEELSAEKALLPRSALLPSRPILQRPELPTGCESVALTIALDALGFELEKTTIASEYLVYSGSNFAQGYVGDPFTDGGAGVFPPGLVLTANAYLETQETSIRAYDATGLDFDSLLTFLAQGRPVVLWVTMSYTDPMWAQDLAEFDLRIYRWYWNEHCVALTGYDFNQGTVTIEDPLQGTLTQSLDHMRQLHDKIGGYAIVLF